MDRNARDFEDLVRGKKQYDTDGQPTGHINLFRNDANSTKWVSAGGTADVSAGTADPTGFSETTFLSSNYALLHRINSRYAPIDYGRSTGLLFSGGYFNASRERERQGALQSKCINSNSCAAGYSCISGQCTRIWGTDPSNVDSCGSLNVNWPCASPNNPGTSKCGNNNGPGSCQEQICGTGIDSRCCRAGNDGQVNCFCRACGDEGQCDPFCDSYNKTHGKPGPGCTPANGVSAGFCNKDVCSECQTCTGSIFGGGKQCVKATSGVPCWCEGAGCDPNNCEKCVKDKDSSSYGQCEYSWEDCADCCTIYNYDCGCGQYIPSVQHCEPHVDPSKPSIRESCYVGARRKAAEICSEACSGPDADPDPCIPKCSTATYCTDTHPEVTSCPAGSVQTGTLTVGDTTCIFCETCDESELPDSCKECDCNCHDDCSECELCGANGECYTDPACENTYFAEYAWYQLYSEYQLRPNNGCSDSGGTVYDGAWLIGATNFGNIGSASLGMSWRLEDAGPPCTTSGTNPCPSTGGHNTDGVPVLADGSDGGRIDLDRATCQGEDFRQTIWKTGVVVGLGSTPEEAVCDAKAKAPKLNIYPSCS